ncbi:DUF427 domain-containing protein [Trujillonella endophytica]|uniref:Uncharacterized conserved protein, DUF427 family n=1 Tax=Trujillonella endophytica TaxID=673521 RepID=A0A1H8PM87_9ACTN|nr:DUF427 domain-containing protein [Trujillella endophytica]SEO42891.1 Uncharacterized conserved protein, DUF427 family [Trujillella endophytica]
MPAYPQSIVPVGSVEPVPRRVRAVLAGRVVLDTTRARYGWEWPPYPQFHVPLADVDPDVLVDEGLDEDRPLGRARRYGLRAGDVERPAAGWCYADGPLAGHLRVEWSALDAWFEEDEEVFVHPRNPYSRVDALRSQRRVRIESGGVVLAESSSPVVLFETGLPPRFYLPRPDVRFEHLVPSDTRTECPYKGRTTGYWSVPGGPADIAWSYDFPAAAVLPIAGLVAFYDEKVDVVLDGVAQERPVTHFSA